MRQLYYGQQQANLEQANLQQQLLQQPSQVLQVSQSQLHCPQRRQKQKQNDAG
jgi:hypothetical protein